MRYYLARISLVAVKIFLTGCTLTNYSKPSGNTEVSGLVNLICLPHYTYQDTWQKNQAIKTHSPSCPETPPLGQEWVRKHKDNIRRLGSIQIDGKSYPVPSTYMKWVEGVEEYQPIKEKIKSQTKTYTDLQLKAKGLNLKGRDQVRVSNSKI